MNALDKIIAQRDEKDYQKLKSRMMIAAKIADVMKERGITQKQLALKLGKKPSEISRLLTGMHNFTHDTLFEIGYALEVKLLCPEFEEKTNMVQFNERVPITIIVKDNTQISLSGGSRKARYSVISKITTDNFNLS